MSKKVLTDMGYDEFQTLIDHYIERSSQQSGEMPASTFFALLFEKAAQRATGTIEVTGRVVDGQLVLTPLAERGTGVQTHGNQILVGDRRIVVTLEGDGQQGAGA